jgi:hypothetical protein
MKNIWYAIFRYIRKKSVRLLATVVCRHKLIIIIIIHVVGAFLSKKVESYKVQYLLKRR